MTVDIKITNAELDSLGVDAVREAKYHFKPEKFSGFFVADNEIIFTVDGEAYTTSYDTVTLALFHNLINKP